MPKKHLEDDFSHIPNVAYVSPLELKPNRVLIGLGVAAIVVVLGTLGYLLVDKLFLGESATAVPNIEITKKSPTTKVATPNAQKDETADWKTFTDKENGYQISYPSKYKISQESAFEVPALTIISPERNLSSYSSLTILYLPRSYLKEYEQLNQKTYEDSIFLNLPITPTTLGGKPAKKYIKEQKDGDVLSGIYLQHKGNGYALSTEVVFKDELDTFDQIISTFKFLD